MGTALAASPLVEEHDPVRGGVEELPLERLGSAAWAAVHEEDRLAVGVELADTGRVVRSASTVTAGTKLTTKLLDGEVDSVVSSNPKIDESR